MAEFKAFLMGFWAQFLTVFLGVGNAYDNVLPDFLWLGNVYVAKDYDLLCKLGITHILGLSQFDIAFHNTKRFCYKIVTIRDVPESDLKQHFTETVQYIDECKAEGGKLYLHCNFGRSRSAAILAAYIMSSQNLSLWDAVKLIQQRRPMAHPNHGFIHQLIAWEKGLGSKITNPTTPEQIRQLEKKKTIVSDLKHSPRVWAFTLGAFSLLYFWWVR